MLTVRKAGAIYRADTLINGSRVRLSLGTRNQDAAQRLVSRIEKALAEGPKSIIGDEVKPVLPDFTFKTLQKPKKANRRKRSKPAANAKSLPGKEP